MLQTFQRFCRIIAVFSGLAALALSGCKKEDEKELLKEAVTRPTEIPVVP